MKTLCSAFLATVALAALSFMTVFFVTVSYAGGDPVFVKVPADYKETFTNYATINRSENVQVAKLYANDVAVSQGDEGTLPVGPGSVIIMEVYKVKKDSKGEALVDDDGLYISDKLAAIAVMERKEDWPTSFPPAHRVGGWGFSIFQSDGVTPKENNLDCVTCHTPLAEQQYMFSYSYLDNYVNGG